MTKIRDILTALFKNVCCAHARTLLLCVVFFLLCGAHKAVGVESPAQAELKKAIRQLEERAAELKETDVAGYSTLTNAAKDLHKYTDDGDIVGSKLLVQLLTAANLKKLFKAPVRLDKESGTITLAYAMDNPALIQDFDLNGAKPEFRQGALVIPAADRLTHKAAWIGSVTVTGKVKFMNRSGIHLATSTGWEVDGHSYNAWLIGFLKGGQRRAEQTFSDQYTETADTQFTAFTWELGTRISLNYGKTTIAVPLDAPFGGRILLCGGQGGNQFKEVLVTGTLDTNWIKQVLGIGAP